MNKNLFRKPFEGVFTIFEPSDVETEDGEELSLKKVAPQLIATFEDGYSSWDGEFWWMPKEVGEQFIPFAEKWYQEHFEEISNNYSNENDNGFSDVLFYMRSNNGLFILDPVYVDFGSSAEQLMADFIKEYSIEEDVIKNYEDAHMIDNISFDRVKNEPKKFDLLKQLIAEDVLNDSVIFNSFYNYFDSTPTDLKIVLTGTFSQERSEIKSILKEAGLTVIDKVNSSDCWLWTGEKVGNNKINDAKKYGTKISTPYELIDELFIPQRKKTLSI